MDNQELLKQILKIGKEMLRCGAEVARAEDSLTRIFRSYGFTSIDIWVISSSIQVTVETAEGQMLTETCAIQDNGIDYDRLDRLNALSRGICAQTPSVEEIDRRLREILARPEPKAVWEYLGAILGCSGFSVSFGCGSVDLIVSALAAVVLTFRARFIRRHESNTIVYNFIISFFVALLINYTINAGLGSNAVAVLIGMVMLLISGLSTTNGLRDLLHRDTISGILNISSSLVGATGIALGITLSLLIVGVDEVAPLSAVPAVNEILGSTVACIGFALLFRFWRAKCLWSAFGAFLMISIYRIAMRFSLPLLEAVIIASAFAGFYAQIMARINKTPSTAFLTIAVLPIIPGAKLFYMMYYIVNSEFDKARSAGADMLLVCLGIALGFLFIDVTLKYLTLFLQWIKRGVENRRGAKEAK